MATSTFPSGLVHSPVRKPVVLAREDPPVRDHAGLHLIVVLPDRSAMRIRMVEYLSVRTPRLAVDVDKPVVDLFDLSAAKNIKSCGFSRLISRIDRPEPEAARWIELAVIQPMVARQFQPRYRRFLSSCWVEVVDAVAQAAKKMAVVFWKNEAHLL